MRKTAAFCAAPVAAALIFGSVTLVKADEIIPPCLPFPACLGGGGPGGNGGQGGGSGSHHPHKHIKAGKVVGQTIVYGFAASSIALIVRGGYVSLAENREMMYGEAYCTAELFSPLIFKPLRLLGNFVGGGTIPLTDIAVCPEEKLNAKYSPQLHAKVHKLKPHRH